MPIISLQQTIAYAKKAGFAGSALENICAIAMAESGLDTSVVNSIGATGILQILIPVHPDVTSAQAMDPAFSFRYAYKLSSGGTNLCPWQSFSSSVCGASWDNRYAQYLPQVRAAIAGNGGGSASSNGIAGLPTGGEQWYQFPINQGNDYATSYKGPGTDTPHYAVDLETPMDTPFYFLQPGTIKVADYQAWGGEVYEQPDSGGPEEYVYHLDQINVTAGQHVTAGQKIGLTGGQTSGGSHPTSSQYSTGPHTHFGLFTKFVSSQNGTIPYGPDPNTLIDEAKGSGGVALTDSGSTTDTSGGAAATTETEPVPLHAKVNAVLSKFPGFEGIALALDTAERFPGIIWYNVNSTATFPPIPSWIPGAYGINKSNDATAAIFDSQDYIGAGIRSILDTITSNLTPLLFRSVIVGIGLLLVGGLILNAINAGANSPLGQDFGSIAKVAAVAA